jgi:hypothetical protein
VVALLLGSTSGLSGFAPQATEAASVMIGLFKGCARWVFTPERVVDGYGEYVRGTAAVNCSGVAGP